MLHPFFSCLFHNFVTSSYFFCAFHAGTLDRNLNRFGVAPFIFSSYLAASFYCCFFLPFHSAKDDFIFLSPPFAWCRWYDYLPKYEFILLCFVVFFPTRLAVERSHVNALRTLSLFLFRFAPLLFAPLYNLLFENNSIQSMYRVQHARRVHAAALSKHKPNYYRNFFLCSQCTMFYIHSFELHISKTFLE